MVHPTEQFTELTKALHVHSGRFASLSLDKAERFARFNLAATDVVLQQGAYTGQAIAGIKDVAAITSLHAKLAETAVLNVKAYSRGVSQVATDAQADFSTVVEDAWAAWRDRVTSWVESSAKNSPAGSQAAVDAFKTTMAATSAAFDHFSQANRRVAQLADQIVRNATLSALTAA
jgi:Phasin protein